MYKSYCEFEDSKAGWILNSANEIDHLFHWDGVNLRSSWIRNKWTDISGLDRGIVDDLLVRNVSVEVMDDHLNSLVSNRITHSLRASPLYKKARALKQRAVWIGHQTVDKPKGRPLIAVHHWKFVNHLRSGRLLEEIDPMWLVKNPSQAQFLGLRDKDPLLAQSISLEQAESDDPLAGLKDIFFDLELTVISSEPSCIFVIEGDAPYQSILSEIGLKHKIPVYCLQWGIFHKNKLRTAFSGMSYSKFLSWGFFFEKQLKEHSPHLDFIKFGYPALSRINEDSKNIIFLSQGVGDNVEEKHEQELIRLAIDLAKKFPERVRWRSHPNSTLTIQAFSNLVKGGVEICDSKAHIGCQLQDSMIAIGISTSSLVDAVNVGVIPVIFNSTCQKNYPFPIVEDGLGMEFGNSYDALKGIADIISNKDSINKFRERILEKSRDYFHPVTMAERKGIIKQLVKN